MVGRKWLAGLVVVLGMAVSAPQAMAKQDILFGGASITGVYYQVALQLSNMMNKHTTDKYNYIGRPTGGSVFNINAIDHVVDDFFGHGFTGDDGGGHGVSLDAFVHAFVGAGRNRGHDVVGVLGHEVFDAVGVDGDDVEVDGLGRFFDSGAGVADGEEEGIDLLVDQGAGGFSLLQGLSAPLHPGAIKYYKEKGWM